MIAVYIRSKLDWIINDNSKLINIKCNTLYCNDVRLIKQILLLDKFIRNVSKSFNIRIDLHKIIPNKYRKHILNIYGHIIEKHTYILKNISNNIFGNVCNNTHNCEHLKRNRNRKRVINSKGNQWKNMFDEMHDNVLHYNIFRNYGKTNKFISEITNNDVYDYGIFLNYYNSGGNGFARKVVPKWGTLKQEILFNGIERMNALYWEEYYDKATQLQQMEWIQHFKAKNDRLSTKDTNIYKGTIITVEHILAIIFYTDDDGFCFKELPSKF